MKMVAALSLVVGAGVFCAATAGANPIMAHSCNPSTVDMQTVTVALVFSMGPPAPYELYRGSGDGAEFVATVEEGEPSSADMGSGVESTTNFTLQDHCVPVGTWHYELRSADTTVMCGWTVEIAEVDPACAAEDDEGGCALGAGARRTGVAGSWLALIAALGWLVRRRRR